MSLLQYMYFIEVFSITVTDKGGVLRAWNGGRDLAVKCFGEEQTVQKKQLMPRL